MRTRGDAGGRPRWSWARGGGARLFAADGVEYELVDDLTRVEVERLLALGELEAAEVRCGKGVHRWARPGGARGLWLDVEASLDDVPSWRPPTGAPGTLPYRAELWRGPDGRHVILFTNE